MVPIVQLVKEHVGLVRKLRWFSFSDTAQFIAGLSLCPELHANTIRIEVLQHLVAISCVGRAQPNSEDLAEWLGKQMAESSAARMEDPVEDVFVGCVNSEFGSFRIIAGVFADGDFWTERLLAFLAEKQNFPPFEMAVQSVLPLLRISDALAERTKLTRYSAGGGLPFDKTQIPQWRKVLAYAKAVHFSTAELAAMGIDFELLREFTLTDQRKAQLQAEELWNSSLERYPLIELADGVIVAAPSSLVRAAIRFLLEQITKSLGGWADTFFEVETASIFVNDVRRRLEIEPLNFKPPPWPDGLQPMLPFFGQFDYGKPVIMLTHCTPLSKSAAAFNGYERFSDDGKLQAYLRSCATEFEKMPGFSGGLILICMASVGYNFVVGINQDIPNWHIDVAMLPDWLTITALGDCNAMRLWKLGEHEAILHGYHVKTLNLSGLLNLYAFWKSNGFRLVPRDTDARSLTLLTINCDFATSLRVETKKRRDIHCVRSQVSVSPRAWLVSVPVFEKSVTYVLGHLEHARFPKDFFHSGEMQTYVGNVTNQRGHDFAEKVGKVFSDSDCTTKLEIEVTQLGASKKLCLGDVDVLSWENTSGRVYAVECKRLLTANSVREVVQRLEDFRGDKKEMDSLGRHLRRIEWLKKNLGALAKFTGIPTGKIRLIPLLVTSEIVPMQFYDGMKFPTSQVLSFDEVAATIRKG